MCGLKCKARYVKSQTAMTKICIVRAGVDNEYDIHVTRPHDIIFIDIEASCCAFNWGPLHILKNCNDLNIRSLKQSVMDDRNRLLT